VAGHREAVSGIDPALESQLELLIEFLVRRVGAS
jgi:hypothetical protein